MNFPNNILDMLSKARYDPMESISLSYVKQVLNDDLRQNFSLDMS